MTPIYQTSLTPEQRQRREDRLAVGRRFREEITASVSAYVDASIAVETAATSSIESNFQCRGGIDRPFASQEPFSEVVLNSKQGQRNDE